MKVQKQECRSKERELRPVVGSLVMFITFVVSFALTTFLLTTYRPVLGGFEVGLIVGTVIILFAVMIFRQRPKSTETPLQHTKDSKTITDKPTSDKVAQNERTVAGKGRE